MRDLCRSVLKGRLAIAVKRCIFLFSRLSSTVHMQVAEFQAHAWHKCSAPPPHNSQLKSIEAHCTSRCRAPPGQSMQPLSSFLLLYRSGSVLCTSGDWCWFKVGLSMASWLLCAMITLCTNYCVQLHWSQCALVLYFLYWVLEHWLLLSISIFMIIIYISILV